MEIKKVIIIFATYSVYGIEISMMHLQTLHVSFQKISSNKNSHALSGEGIVGRR